MKPSINKRLYYRAALVILWVGLGTLLFVFNRGHTLLVDNQNVEEPALTAPDLIKVTVDTQKPLEFFRGDRDRFALAGTNHRLRVEFTDGRPPFEAAFALPLAHDMYILSIPRLLAGLDPAVEPFVQSREAIPPADELPPVGDDAAMPEEFL